LALVALQLLPMPTSLLAKLPKRAGVLDDLAQAGVAQGWRSMTLDTWATVRAGLSPDELPIGLQLVASHGREELLFHPDAIKHIRDSLRLIDNKLRNDPKANNYFLTMVGRLRADASHTPSLAGGPHSVLCAPIFDPVRDAVLAVIYLQNSGLAEAYGESDRAWLEGYAAAVGRLFGLSFRQSLQDRELRELREARGAADNMPEILGDSSHTAALRRVLHETFIPAMEVENPEPTLVLGERGTGKDLIARYLHAYSSRHKRPLVVVNCAEITDELAASRFFGHKRGSFTGALTDEPGFFRAADGGVLFLDEVAELSPRAQAHLLRVLENHTVTPVGQTREHKVNVAVVLATNRELDQAVRDGALRADFYDRFRTLAIRLLPLRERPWDIPPLLEHYRRHHERKHRKPTLGFTREAFRSLVSHDWPGNVRDLARACSLFVIHAQPGAWIDRDLIARCLPEVLSGTPNPKAGPLLAEGVPLSDAVEAFERELILSRLEQHGGNVKAARESLGLTKTTFHRTMKRLGIATGVTGPE